MKKILAVITIGIILVGCNEQEDMTNVFSPGAKRTEYANQCKASCVINDLQYWDEIIAPEDTASMLGLIGDTLRTYVYRLEDGREGLMEKVDFDTLIAGDVLPHCNVIEAEGSCPQY